MKLIPIPPEGSPDTALIPTNGPVRAWIDGNQAFYREAGFVPPWTAYLAVEDDAVVGTCAFKGAPKAGIVEIAYATHPDLEGRGIATRMAMELLRISRTTDPAVRIIAQTLPEVNASTRVLTKCGFAQVRDAVDDEAGTVWEWELVTG